ncbi:hypothetical protein F5Y15DRAFT_174323 [Xylariaceae sp. FL0016]|nr:hypothetical protein F5Y15DRAFT_174323 [Xylariaceae sp. FL0016]
MYLMLDSRAIRTAARACSGSQRQRHGSLVFGQGIRYLDYLDHPGPSCAPKCAVHQPRGIHPRSTTALPSQTEVSYLRDDAPFRTGFTTHSTAYQKLSRSTRQIWIDIAPHQLGFPLSTFTSLLRDSQCPQPDSAEWERAGIEAPSNAVPHPSRKGIDAVDAAASGGPSTHAILSNRVHSQYTPTANRTETHARLDTQHPLELY